MITRARNLMCQKLCQVIPMVLMLLSGCGGGDNRVLEEVVEQVYLDRTQREHKHSEPRWRGLGLWFRWK